MKRRIAITKDQLRALRDRGLTRDQMAEKLNTSLATIKRRLAEYELVERRTAPSSATDGKVRPSETEYTMTERARMILGPRMGQGPQGYTLDGRPASVWDLLGAAGLEITEPN